MNGSGASAKAIGHKHLRPGRLTSQPAGLPPTDTLRLLVRHVGCHCNTVVTLPTLQFMET
jgi:hypothetical protein